MSSPAYTDAATTDAGARPRKLSGVVVSVNYGDRLVETLPRNIRLFDQFVVVTTEDDLETQRAARENGATLVLSNRCFEDDHAFNKGRMLNEGLAALKDPDWVILTDADITLNPRTRENLFGRSLNPDVLYFTERQDLTPVSNQPTSVNREPNGYFQLFNPKATSIRANWPRPMCEEFCSAGSIDSWFWQQWPRDKVEYVADIFVQHIASAHLGENWNGVPRKKSSGKWSQFGILTSQGFSAFQPVDRLPDVIKLTDTKFGQSVVIESKDVNEYVRIVPEGLEFLGKKLEWCHIHVAYRD